MSEPTARQLLGIDWGTSNRRAYLIDCAGNLLARHEDSQGVLAAGRDFAASLAALRRQLGACAEVVTVMSGTVGSASGWQEVPYLDTTEPLAGLPARLVPVAGHPNCYIVPGYCHRGAELDVMRGEETQLLGALALGIGDGWAVLPGTHSKWVQHDAGQIQQFATYMTGELFAMLAAGGTLAPLMESGAEDEAAFAAGLNQAQLGKPLSHTLFGVRARVVANAMPAAQTRSWISGLLIGTEFVAARREAGTVISIIASAALSGRYADAAAHFKLRAQRLDPDEVYRAALLRFVQGTPLGTLQGTPI